MDFDVSNISQSTSAVLAAVIGAFATITTSMMSLRLAWKKELLDRANNKPVTKKNKRGPILPVLALLVASAVGGFALSYFYLGNKGNGNSEVLSAEQELRAKIEQLSASTQRLETVSFNGADTIAQQVRDEERRKRGAEGSAAVVMLEKCASADGQTSCTESNVRPVRLCAEIPANASVATIDLYARPEGDTRSWSESRVVAGNDFGGGRFTNRSTEHLISDSTKQVCQELLHWSSDHALNGRIVVHYGIAN